MQVNDYLHQGSLFLLRHNIKNPQDCGVFLNVLTFKHTNKNNLMENNLENKQEEKQEEIKIDQAEKIQEEEKIQKVQFLEPVEIQERIEAPAVDEKKEKRSFLVELVLFFILGVLIGIVVKTEAVKKITIGFDDYRMKIHKNDYNLSEMEAKVAAMQEAQGDQSGANQNESANPDGSPDNSAGNLDSGNNQ